MDKLSAAESVIVTRPEPAIISLTLHRPDRLNALTREMVAAINEVLDSIATDGPCRALVVTGAGRGFCSGQDVAAANERALRGGSSVIEKLHWQQAFAGIGARLRAMPQRVVAAVNGAAVGAGMAMACSADARLCAQQAVFLVGAERIGLSGGESGLSYLLPRLIGASRAFDILITGRSVVAQEAKRIGLAVRVTERERLVEEAIDYARSALANSPFSIAHTKRLMWDNLDAAYHPAVELENRTQILATLTADYGEATAAFAARRFPQFTGG